MTLTFEQSKRAPTSTTETSPNWQSISLDALSQQQLKAALQQHFTTPVVTSH